MNNTFKGFYQVKNRDKCANSMPYFKSSWELAFMKMCDDHPAILQWSYEPFKIPYRNPLTHEYTVYVPDFLIVFLDKRHKRQVQLIEIKPSKQTFVEKARSKVDKVSVAVNAAKWEAAAGYASRNGMTFRILSENDIYRNP